MDREQARDTVKGYLEDYLRSKGINTRKPFNCLSPDHNDTHPSMSYDRRGQRCKCFSCGVSYDIFDLIGIDYGLSDDKDIFNKAYELYNINIDAPAKNSKEPAKKKPAAKPEPKPAEDFMDYYKRAQASRSEAPAQEYLKSRGISEAVAAKYWLGYDAAYNTFDVDEAGQQSFSKWRALIIPTGKGSFIARNIDQPKEPAKKNRYRKKGASVIFNSKALYTASKPIFVVEGELDALSIIEAGGEAIGLGSTSNYAQLVSLIKTKQAAQPLILALDADEDGRKTEEKLAEELTTLQASFYRYNLYGAAKDANEALLLDRDGFISEVAAAERAKEAELEAIAEAAKEDYLKTSAAHELQNFLGGITASADTPALSTGFKNLDSVLDGGLYEGLYIIGAISSLGKTTLALQIIDQLAQQGQDCLVFSLEMARSELIAKSISRLTYLAADHKADAKTTRGITAGARWKNYNDTEKALINKAMQQYKDYAQHIYIHEGVGDIGIQQVADTVKQHIAITGNKPVVLIDYLQILAPYDMRASDKQNTDKATLELKRLSRDYKIPVIGISSFNRDNYTAPVNNASFKESGAIEYSADVLIGLQYAGMDYQEGETDNARQKRIRELIKGMEDKARTGEAQKLQAKVLKNRNGSKGQAEFSFYAMFNCFKEYMPDFEPVKDTPDVFKGMAAK